MGLRKSELTTDQVVFVRTGGTQLTVSGRDGRAFRASAVLSTVPRAAGLCLPQRDDQHVPNGRGERPAEMPIGEPAA
jgi:hypothetical protein